MTRLKPFTNKISLISEQKETIGDDAVIEHIYKHLSVIFGLDDTKKDTIIGALKDVEYGIDYEVDYRQNAIKRLSRLMATKGKTSVNTASIAINIKDAVKSSSIYEGLVKVKRKHTDNHPAVVINDKASVRNKIINYIGEMEKARASRKDIIGYFKQLKEDEEIGRMPHPSWLNKNKHLVKKIKVGNDVYYKLTRTGRKVFNHINASKEGFEPLGIK